MKDLEIDSHLEQNASASFTEKVLLNQQKLTAELKPHYDFIVCGSGSSGSVVANLSNPYKLCAPIPAVSRKAGLP